MNRLLTAIALVASISIAPGCGLTDPECRQVPGHELVPGTYALTALPSAQWEEPLAALLPGPTASNVTLTLSDDRQWVTIRYEVEGEVIEDRWAVTGSID